MQDFLGQSKNFGFYSEQAGNEQRLSSRVVVCSNMGFKKSLVAMWRTDQGIDVKKDELEDYYNNPRKIRQCLDQDSSKKDGDKCLDSGYVFKFIIFFFTRATGITALPLTKQEKTTRGVYLLDGVRARLSGAQRHANFQLEMSSRQMDIWTWGSEEWSNQTYLGVIII